jgi:hypothetical protein
VIETYYQVYWTYEYVKGSIGLASIVDKIRENRLRWFGHMMKQEETKAVTVVMKMNVEGKYRRRRPKNRWLDIIENDMRTVGVYIGDVENQDEWRFRTKVANPNRRKVWKKKNMTLNITI